MCKYYYSTSTPDQAHSTLPMPSHMYQSTTIWTLKHKSASANLAQT